MLAPFLGSLLLLPVSAVVVLAVAVALGLAVLLGVIGGVTGSGVVAVLGGLAVSALGFVGLEKLLRAGDARRAPHWVIEIGTLARSERVGVESVGGEAMSLARAAGLGVSVPDSVVLTSELVEQWVSAVRKARPGVDATTLLPAVARSRLNAFLHRAAGGKIAVRASFGTEDARATYPGVFASARDIDPERVDLLVKAIVRVVDSGYGNAAAEYRQKLRIAATLKRAVVLQRQVEADLLGTAQSRGLDGRGDSVLIDFGKPRSVTTSVSLDLIDGSALAVAPNVALETTPSWMNRLAGLLVALDTRIGGTVLVDFAVHAGQLIVLGLRRVQTAEPTTWLSDGGPLESAAERLPRWINETYGPPEQQLEAASRALGRLGGARADDVRDEDGVRYLNVDLLRRGLGRLALAVLLKEPLWPLFALSRPLVARPLPPLPEVSGDLPDSWRRFVAWRGRFLLPLVADRVELGMRRWLIEWVMGMLADGATGERVPRVHQTLRKILGQRAKSSASEGEKAGERLRNAEQPMRDFAAQLMARGATDWNAVFVGDRHLYAGFTELGLWVSDPSLREASAKVWDDEKRAFEARRLRAVPPRRVEPPPPAAMMSRPDSALPVVGLVPGSAEGPAMAPTEYRGEPPPGCVVVVPDGRPEFALPVLRAHGLVLAGGGLLSPMAQLARELGIVTVACVERVPIQRFPLGSTLAIDGSLGALRC